MLCRFISTLSTSQLDVTASTGDEQECVAGGDLLWMHTLGGAGMHSEPQGSSLGSMGSGGLAGGNTGKCYLES
jgi:hypothetical protein